MITAEMKQCSQRSMSQLRSWCSCSGGNGKASGLKTEIPKGY